MTTFEFFEMLVTAKTLLSERDHRRHRAEESVHQLFSHGLSCRRFPRSEVGIHDGDSGFESHKGLQNVGNVSESEISGVHSKLGDVVG